MLPSATSTSKLCSKLQVSEHKNEWYASVHQPINAGQYLHIAFLLVKSVFSSFLPASGRRVIISASVATPFCKNQIFLPAGKGYGWGWGGGRNGVAQTFQSPAPYPLTPLAHNSVTQRVCPYLVYLSTELGEADVTKSWGRGRSDTRIPLSCSDHPHRAVRPSGGSVLPQTCTSRI